MSQKFTQAAARFIFWSRWLQLPMYMGLIVALGVYVYKFFVMLSGLVVNFGGYGENDILLIVLALIDVVMIANLLVMVIIGGYEIFVSRLHIDDHPDQPEWLDHVDAGVLKIKLGMALVSISSIHLLRSFNVGSDYSYGFGVFGYFYCTNRLVNSVQGITNSKNEKWWALRHEVG
jgi:uncharacterized protein (TIGR00645 family)